jgi:crotonobetainyl-CoA:carnitine CoA-transferase CaiB-like acyl-CoA transferase
MQMTSSLPMAGIRIIDVTHDWAGPHATRLLADFGAEVIKVENSRRLDGMRGGYVENERYNQHPRWWEINRNKKSVTLDLKAEWGVAAFKDLVAVSDVLVENSRPGVMERLGLGYAALRALRPDLIYLSMSAFGHTGPHAAYAGYGGCIEPLSGIESLTGYAGDPRPRRIKEVDVTNGVLGACALMTALLHRCRTGVGQWIDLSQMEAATSGLIGEQLLELVMLGCAPAPNGNRDRQHAPRGAYPCQGEDQWVALSIRSESEWAAFCDVIGRPELRDDDRFATAAMRANHHDELDEIIATWTSQRSHYAAMHDVQRVGIAAGAVLNVAELTEDPHLQSRGYFVADPDGSGACFPGLPIRMSNAHPQMWGRGPRLGEHNQEILCGLLSRSPDESEPLTPDTIGTAFDIEAPARPIEDWRSL